MPHLLVAQLRFTRSELVRAFEGVTAEDALQRLGPMNSLSWIVGHIAWHEQLYWLERAQGKTLMPELHDYGYGKPASTPPLDAMWQAWYTVTLAADPYLDTLTPDLLVTTWANAPTGENIGTRLMRMIYHYWYHLGESQAIRQLLKHDDLPGFVGNMSDYTYHPE